MPVIHVHETVHVPYMLPPEPERSWTEQPGSAGEHLCVDVLGSAVVEGASEHLLAEQAVASAVHDVQHAPPSGSIVRLRDYQKEAIAAVFSSWERGKKAPIIVAATGSGKTVMAAELMRQVVEPKPLGRALFVAHRKELLDQTVAKVKLVAPRCTVGLVQAEHNEVGRKITVASIQTLASRNGERVRQVIGDQPPDLVVIDECHHAPSRTHVKVIEQLREANPKLVLLGLTATPGRADGLSLDRIFDDVAYERNLFDLIRDGYLVPPRGIRVDLDLNLDAIETRNGDYVESKLSRAMNQPSVRRAIVRAWQEHGLGRKMIVFCVDVQHAKDMAAEFSAAGHPAAYISGTMKDRERQDVYERFRTGRLRLMCSVEVLTEGFDEPSVEGVVFARPTQSQGLYLQGLGRALRLYPGKSEALVLDCVGNSERHSPVQLASLAGLNPIINDVLPEEDKEEISLPVDDDPDAVIEVGDITAREFDFKMRSRKTRYAWRETQYGWTLQIPRVGYFLVAWHDKDHVRATVRFHDMREGRRDTPPVVVVRDPIEFDMAYGLVEGEVERLTSRRASQHAVRASDEPPPFAFLLDDGLEEDLHVAEQVLLNDAGWRDKAMTPRQREALLKMGLKEANLPATAGEAGDLITIMQVERDARMREPATDKQMWYLRANKIPHDKTLTKNAAKRLILAHRTRGER